MEVQEPSDSDALAPPNPRAFRLKGSVMRSCSLILSVQGLVQHICLTKLFLVSFLLIRAVRLSQPFFRHGPSVERKFRRFSLRQQEADIPKAGRFAVAFQKALFNKYTVLPDKRYLGKGGDFHAW